MAKKTLPVKVTIPTSLKKVEETLNGLAYLMTATGWHRAAIVYAHTTNQQGSNQHRRKSSDAQMSITAFAELGFNGLKNREAVRNWRNVWANEPTTDKDIRPGDEIELPEMEFPVTDKGNVGSRGLSKDPVTALEQIKAAPVEVQKEVAVHLAVKTDEPEVKEAVEEAVASDPRAVGRINKKAAAEPKAEKTPKPPKEPDLDGEFQDAAAIIVSRLADKWAGRWNPNDRSLTFEHFLRRVLNDQNDVEATGGVLVEEITAFLEEVAS